MPFQQIETLCKACGEKLNAWSLGFQSGAFCFNPDCPATAFVREARYLRCLPEMLGKTNRCHNCGDWRSVANAILDYVRCIDCGVLNFFGSLQ